MIKVNGEPDFKSPIYQRNESDYEFILRAAHTVGALFFIHLGKLYFISPSCLKSPVLIFTFPTMGVISMRCSVSIWGMPKSVEVVGWNPKDYKTSVTSNVTTPEAIGNGKIASNLTKNISSTNVLRIIDNSIESVKEANFIAQAKVNMRNLELSEVNIETMGNPEVELACGVKIDNVGNSFDNNYIISGIEHELRGKEYTTKLRLVSNMITPEKKSLKI
jgi:phage protein D